MKRGMGNKVGNVSVSRWTVSLNTSLRSTFILETTVQGDMNKNRGVRRWSRYAMEEDGKFNVGQIGFKMYQEPSCWFPGREDLAR